MCESQQSNRRDLVAATGGGTPSPFSTSSSVNNSFLHHPRRHHHRHQKTARWKIVLVCILLPLGLILRLFVDRPYMAALGRHVHAKINININDHTATEATTAATTSPLSQTYSSNSPPPFSSSCSEYRPYPWPDHHSGLPYLGDVFASRDGQWIYMIALNRGMCMSEYIESDKFPVAQGAEWPSKHYETFIVPHRFMCVFSDKTHVLTEFVQKVPQLPRVYMIRCRIPEQYQHLVRQPRDFTTLHFDLHSMDDLELEESRFGHIRAYPSIAVTDTPKIASVPVCHPLETGTKNHYNMVAVTTVKSVYSLSSYSKFANETKFSALGRIPNWIDYHLDQGFDHLILYDNDEEPHGPFEKLTRPLVEAGLATYKWFPLKNCHNDYGDEQWNDFYQPYAQAVSSMSTLFRYRGVADFVAHMDVDEYFVPLEKDIRVIDFVAQARFADVDYFSFLPTVMAPCNGTTVSSHQPVVEKWTCLSDSHRSDKKVIMRPHRIDNFWVHFPLLSVDGDEPREYVLNEQKEGFLAHYRASDRPGGFWRDEYDGYVENGYTNETYFMRQFLERRRKAQRSVAVANFSAQVVPVAKGAVRTEASTIPTNVARLSERSSPPDRAGLTFVILSDRLDAVMAALGSVVRASSNLIRIIMIGSEETSRKTAEHFADRIAGFEAYTLQEVQQDLEQQGLHPIWQWDEWHSSLNDPNWRNRNTVRPGSNLSPSHAHELNHLRFYLPYISALKGTSHYFVLDDDVLVQRDLVNAARQVISNVDPSKGLTCPCHFWSWESKCNGFALKNRDTSIWDTSILFSGRPRCKDPDQDECVSDTFEHFIRIATPPNASKPEVQSVWNFGMCLIHKDNWHNLDLTGRYEYTMKVQYDFHSIPENSVSFGLGLPFLAFAGAVDCWNDDTLQVVDGLGVIEWLRLAETFGPEISLVKVDVLHYSGPNKPWLPNTPLDFRIVAPWLSAMAREGLMVPPQLDDNRSDSSLFLVVSSSDAASGWLMTMMDQHGDICAPDGARISDVSFPVDSLSPDGVWSPSCSIPYGCSLEFVTKEILKMASTTGTKSLNGSSSFGTIVPTRCELGYHPDTEEDGAIESHRARLCNFFDQLQGNFTKEAILSKWVDAFVREDHDLLACKCPRGTRVKGLRWLSHWAREPSIESMLETASRGRKVIQVKRMNLWDEYRLSSLTSSSYSEQGLRISIPNMVGVFQWMEEQEKRMNAWVSRLGADCLSIDAQACYEKPQDCRNAIGNFLNVDASKFSQEFKPLPGYSPAEDPLANVQNRDDVEEVLVQYGVDLRMGQQATSKE